MAFSFIFRVEPYSAPLRLYFLIPSHTWLADDELLNRPVQLNDRLQYAICLNANTQWCRLSDI